MRIEVLVKLWVSGDCWRGSRKGWGKAEKNFFFLLGDLQWGTRLGRFSGWRIFL